MNELANLFRFYETLTSLCLLDGVLELDEMFEWGLCDGYSFLMFGCLALGGSDGGVSLELPFSRGDEFPFVPFNVPLPLDGAESSLATSTTNSWSLFSPSLSYGREKRKSS